MNPRPERRREGRQFPFRFDAKKAGAMIIELEFYAAHVSTEQDAAGVPELETEIDAGIRISIEGAGIIDLVVSPPDKILKNPRQLDRRLKIEFQTIAHWRRSPAMSPTIERWPAHVFTICSNGISEAVNSYLHPFPDKGPLEAARERFRRIARSL